MSCIERHFKLGILTTILQFFLTSMSTIKRGEFSLNKAANSPFWMVTFTGGDGRQKRRSTKVPVKGGLYGKERLTAAQAKVRAEIVGRHLAEEEKRTYEVSDNRTVREICDSMLSGKLGRVSLATYDNARTDYKQFLAWLGSRADAPIRLITRADIKDWVAARRSQVRAGTVHKALSAIRAAFTWAVDAEIIPKNPCDGVRVPPDSKEERVVHEAFTIEEVQLLIDKLPDEWSSAVRCCIGTYGQRLGDILSLRWSQFDWTARTVTIITGKTARTLHQPMQPDFYEWARARYEAAQAAGGDAAIFVHPTLHRHSNPSPEFTQLVRLHGIGVVGKSAGGNRRTWHSKTFHSLRATVATMLQAAGVSQGLAMELVGHESADVHAVYIRPNADQLRAAAAKLPRFA